MQSSLENENRNANKISQRPKVHLHNFQTACACPTRTQSHTHADTHSCKLHGTKSKAVQGLVNKKTKKTLANPFDEVNASLVSQPKHTHTHTCIGQVDVYMCVCVFEHWQD